MSTQAKRPVFLNLLQIKLPIPGILSILHRASGVVMVLLIPLCAYLLGLSLRGEQGFEQASAFLGSGLIQLLLVLFGWGVVHHLFAGIRYLVIDFDRWIDRPTARLSAQIAMAAAAVVGVVLGVAL